MVGKVSKMLLIIGKSGCGKTTLAKHLEQLDPKRFKRIVQCTSREMRDDEEDTVDYFFLTRAQMQQKIRDDELTAVVAKQFKPSLYGTNLEDLEEGKTNILIASIEGLLNCLTDFPDSYSKISVLWIANVNNGAEAERVNRNADAEEIYIDIILSSMMEMSAFKKLNIVKVDFNHFKTFRNDDRELLKFLKIHGIK